MSKKILRILLWTVAVLLLLIGSSFVLLQVPSVQTWLAQRATAYLSDELKTKVTVGKVSIQFFKKVSLKNLYIEDLHHDTLFYADELLIDIKELSTSQHYLDLNKITLDHAKFFLTRHHGENSDNLKFLSDYFASGDTSATSAKWTIKLRDVRFEDVTFRHDVEDDKPEPGGVDFAHLDVKNVYGDLNDISFVNDSIFVNVDKLRFKDKSGFQLDELSTDAKVASDELRLNKLIIRTPSTDLHTDLTFRYDSMSAFNDFLEKINFNSHFKNSTVSFTDIAFFATDLKGMNSHVKLDGDFKGTVSKFHGKNVTISFGEHSFFKGNVAMTGLPVISETYMDILATDVQVNKKDIESIPLPPFNEHNHLEVPENLVTLGKVNFKGKFTGFFSDFVAYGNITTDIGFISSDMNLKVDRQKKTTIYSGHISTNHFNVGKVFSSNDLGELTMSADIKGSGLKLENADAKLNGTIEAIGFRGYVYRGIKLNGEVAKKLFSGAVAIHEPNIDLDFSGTINFKPAVPDFNFTADIGKAHLDTLNLFNMKGEEMLKTKIVAHFSGKKIDDLEGTIRVDSTDFRFDKVLYHINHMFVSAENINSARSINIQSDNLDADFKGQFEFSTLGDAFKQIMPRYLSNVILPVKSIPSKQDFSFNIRLKNMSVITENFFPSWEVDPNTTINGKFNSLTNDILLNIESSSVRFKNFHFVNTRLNASAGNETMKVALDAGQLFYSDSSYIPSFQFNASTSGNKISFMLQMADSTVYADRANLKGELNFASSKKFDLQFKESSIALGNEIWTMDPGNKISFDSSAIDIRSFSFSKSNEQVNINGIVSKNEKDQLVADFKNFNLKNLNPLLVSSNIKIGGLLNGKAIVADAYKKIKLVSNLDIEKIQFNDDTLGNASFITGYDADKKKISVDAYIQNGSVKTIAVTGEYQTDKEKDNLDFNVKLNNFYLTTIAKYIDDIVSELSGRLSADLKLTGDFSRPVFKGNLNLNRVHCKVNYLNTRYNFTNDITVGENYFELKDFKIFDERSESAIANGRITHSYFKDFYFNVNLDANKFQCLNTGVSENAIYYGTANASGSAYFSGPLESMNMQIQFTSEKGTEIYIPLTNTSEVSQSNFISFREKGKFNIANALTNRVNLSGIKLDMTLDMTPDAEIQIIFDEKIGDKIIGRGYGNLRLDINTVGDFNMYGTYSIESGSYMFTLQNIINKKFEIERGGSISWGGNPYDADINLDAVYTTSTSTLYKILPDSSYRTRLKVDCRLNLSNKLMNPTIKYSINVRGVDASAQSQIQSALNSEAEVSKQMFGLLVLNQFIPTGITSQASNKVDAGAGAGASGVEFLSDQVNNWLSQVSKDVNIGVNYKARDIYSKEEMELMFSKSLANDRLLVEGSVGRVAATGDQTTSNIVGDFNAEYKLSEDGRVRVRAFNKSNTSNFIYNYAPYSQGIGILYRKEFDKFHLFGKRAVSDTSAVK